MVYQKIKTRYSTLPLRAFLVCVEKFDRFFDAFVACFITLSGTDPIGKIKFV